MNFQLFKRKFLIFSCYDLIFSCPEKDRKMTNRYPWCQHVHVQISNWSASVVALDKSVRLLPSLRPHFYLKLVKFMCLFAILCFFSTYVLVRKSNHTGQPKAFCQCSSLCEFAMHSRKWKCNRTVCSCVAFLLHAFSSCAFLDYLRLF